MTDPYTLLNIRQTATEQEIRQALKKQVELYCGREGNRKSSDGEYLHEMFREAAKKLLDPETRKKVDLELAEQQQRNGVVKYDQKNNSSKAEEPDPYTILGVRKGATEQEIRDALRRQIEKYCKNNSDGEYLKEMFNEAAKKLLNTKSSSSKNAEYEIINKSSDEISPITIAEQNYIITSVNKDILKLQFKPRTIFSGGTYVNDLYGIIGEDNSFMFAYETCAGFSVKLQQDKYRLKALFTYQPLLGEKTFISSEAPWINGSAFKVAGVNSYAILGSKFIPDEIVRGGCVTSENLRILSTCIKRTLISKPEIVKRLFSQDKAAVKEKK